MFVGEFRSGGLHEVLVRHFRARVHRQSCDGLDPVAARDALPRYERERVEVALHMVSASDVAEERQRLIRRLRPRDNSVDQLEPDEVPLCVDTARRRRQHARAIRVDQGGGRGERDR